ncbi:MAG TPA: succinate dehydrogenase assembly factor 2 [Paracoccaceae bacterium]|nr:succinate dehydrogenase assembly factor 2 [Paracoccaceae bacterium]HMO72154.1 succinate dehydrogenase assembly factor 2 [Paracoccaceae bacterium]
MTAAEPDETRRKRLSMRAWRRGTREMDLILGPWADAHLADLEPARLLAFDALLDEADQDLAQWFVAGRPAPADHAPLVAEIAAFALARLRPGGA